MREHLPARLEFTRALDSFVAASGVTLTVFDSSGQRIHGPVIGGRIAVMLKQARAWEPGGGAEEIENRLAARCAKEKAIVSEHLGGVLRVDGIPMIIDGSMSGVLVCGWVLERFASSLECTRLGREIRVPTEELWRAVRAHSPVTPQRFAVLLELLAVIVRAEVSHWVAVVKAQEIDRLRQTFLARVAHDLRTPLSVVALQVDALLAGGATSEKELFTAYERIRRNVTAQQRLIDDLVEAAKTITGTLSISPQPVDLSRIIREVADSMEMQTREKGLHFRYEAGDEPIWIAGDEARLQQVFLNLLSNAVKFTPAGGIVMLRSGIVGDAAHVEVRDTGIGLDDAMAKTLFLPFSRTLENNDKGWGLGLTIAKQLIELHGGAILAESAGRGHGTTMRTTLPLLDMKTP